MQRRRRMVQQPAHSLMNRRVADALIVVEDQVQRVRALIKLINELSKEQGELGRTDAETTGSTPATAAAAPPVDSA